MKISAIKQQVKQQGRYSIFVEGKYSFSLGEAALLETKLHNGLDLTAQQVQDFKKLSGDDKLYNQSLRYAIIRPRSTWEMEFYLQRKKADPLLSQQILSKLSNLRIVDDLTFANSWVSSRRLLKPVSYRRLNMELKQKHVPSEIIEQVLHEDETDEVDTLRELVERKRRQTKYQDDQKLMQFLARQGFSYNDIKHVLSVMEEEA